MQPKERPKNLVLRSARKKPRTGLIAAGVLFAFVLCCVGGILLVRFGDVLGETTTAQDAASIGRTIIYEIIVPNPANNTPAVSSPTPTPVKTPVPTLPPVSRAGPSGGINGLALGQIVVLPTSTAQHILQIYAKGQSLGRNPRAFSKIGDSTMVYPPFLAAFDSPASYKLGAYASLQPTIARFAGSFGRESAAVKKGMHTWTEFDPTWVAIDQCRPNESPLDCEFRLNNPSIAIIRLGANDVPEPQVFAQDLTRIVQYCISNGVIPVLGTKPDHQEGAANTINQLTAQIAANNRIPLWNYDLVAGTVPGRGLVSDNVHMRGGGTHDYTSSIAFQEGDSLEDLTALLMLDAINRNLTAVVSK